MFHGGLGSVCPAVTIAVARVASPAAGQDELPADIQKSITKTNLEPWIDRDRVMIDQLASLRVVKGQRYRARTYKLPVPPDVPVEQYWSVTVYDRETHALVKNMDRASRAPNAKDMVANADGSVDLFFGPTALTGKQSTCVPTDPKRGFELMFRLYGPTEALFDKSWRLPDVEKVES